MSQKGWVQFLLSPTKRWIKKDEYSFYCHPCPIKERTVKDIRAQNKQIVMTELESGHGIGDTLSALL